MHISSEVCNCIGLVIRNGILQGQTSELNFSTFGLEPEHARNPRHV